MADKQADSLKKKTEDPKSASLAGHTSGSDNEIERKTILLKGDITMQRPSLLDIFAPNSWIKKSNFEGIFNLFIFVLLMIILNSPLVNYSVHGAFVEPGLWDRFCGSAPQLVAKWALLFGYSFM